MTDATAPIRLYEGVAPGSEGWTHAERTAWDAGIGADVLFDVVEPVLVPFLTDSARAAATGTAVVINPGGAFHLLAWQHEGVAVARWLNDRGISAFVLKYRLAPCDRPDPHATVAARVKDGSLEAAVAAVLPLATADGRAAVAHVRTHADRYGVRPDRIGMLGFSAGGTLAASVGHACGDVDRPDFLAPIYPHYRWVPTRVVPANPPPMFVAVAADDEFGFARHAIELYDTWTRGGGRAELHVYAQGRHGFGMHRQGLPSDHWVEQFHAWLLAQGFGAG